MLSYLFSNHSNIQTKPKTDLNLTEIGFNCYDDDLKSPKDIEVLIFKNKMLISVNNVPSYVCDDENLEKSLEYIESIISKKYMNSYCVRVGNAMQFYVKNDDTASRFSMFSFDKLEVSITCRKITELN